jgi:hypothetical protein
VASGLGRNLVALKKGVEWIVFPDEGHAIAHAQNQRIYCAGVFKLLERAIGKGEPPFPPPAPGSQIKAIQRTPVDTLANP